MAVTSYLLHAPWDIFIGEQSGDQNLHIIPYSMCNCLIWKQEILKFSLDGGLS